jgi:hypothetical protein
LLPSDSHSFARTRGLHAHPQSAALAARNESGWLFQEETTFGDLKSAWEILKEAGGPDVLLTASQVYSMLEYHGIDSKKAPRNSVSPFSCFLTLSVLNL